VTTKEEGSVSDKLGHHGLTVDEKLFLQVLHACIHTFFESDIKSIRKRTDRKKDRNNKEIRNETLPI